MNSNASSRILVVDDSKVDRDLFKHILTEVGFIVEVANDGKHALDYLKENDVDLVLSDFLMPNMDGQELLLKVRQDPKLSHVIVIIITSDESDEVKNKLIKSGANDFVHKGDSYEEIIARIKVHISAQKAQANRKELELAGEIANNINQPLSVMIVGLDALKQKIQSQGAEQDKKEFLELLATINSQADVLMKLSQDLKELRMDTRKHYKFEKQKKY